LVTLEEKGVAEEPHCLQLLLSSIEIVLRQSPAIKYLHMEAEKTTVQEAVTRKLVKTEV
jgi:hypothetical protein